MRLIFKLPIRIKLAIILTALMSAATISTGIIITAHEKASLEAQMRHMAVSIISEFTDNSKIPLLQDDHLTMNLLTQNILQYPGIVNAYILDEKLFIGGHKELAEVGMEYYGSKEEVLNARGPSPWLIHEDETSLTFANPILFKKINVGYTILSFSKDFIKEKVWETQKKIAFITISVIMAVIILSIPFSSGMLKPIFMLIKGTKELALGNLWYRIPSRKGDEIGNLIDSFNSMASELEKKEILKGAFSRYVSPQVADEILKNPEKIQLAGEKREISVLFVDIRGFTLLARNMKPEDVVELLNRYFTIVTSVIFHFNGTVDKFIGDAVMGVFGSPIPRKDHLEMGIKASLCIKKIMTEFNRQREKSGFVKLPIGIGFASGTVIAGSMGSKVRMEYTAIGDKVNMASRLAGIAKQDEILVSEIIYRKIEGKVSGVRLPEIRIKGVEKPAALYNIVNLEEPWIQGVEESIRVIMDEIREDGVAI